MKMVRLLPPPHTHTHVIIKILMLHALTLGAFNLGGEKKVSFFFIVSIFLSDYIDG